jgi:ribose 5-phosphate isomerase B
MTEKIEKIALGSDHAGYELKNIIIGYLSTRHIPFHDFGTYSHESADYSDFAHQVARAVNRGDFKHGILVCGSGNGVNITANKYINVRAALCWNAEIAMLARLHNDANVLSLPGRFIEKDEALRAVDEFMKTTFEGGRHTRRVQKISDVRL